MHDTDTSPEAPTARERLRVRLATMRLGPFATAQDWRDLTRGFTLTDREGFNPPASEYRRNGRAGTVKRGRRILGRC